ncbi:hypothetical protein [Herbiconiux sp. UC225_62]|uniref:hypothetical protein n=1 Tax=Herbiconiux sp. UC225_62 TaxID=3350168 RepID=UPI0036D323A5
MVPGGHGGIDGLCGLIDEHGVELRGDFQEFFQLDLVDVWRGSITPRRALDLAESLFSVPRSRYRAAVMGDRWLGWSSETAVLADVFDAVRDAMTSNAEIWGGKISAPKYPRPAAKPDMPASKAASSTIADFPIWEMVRSTS